jgi:signal transduction histidine kinase
MSLPWWEGPNPFGRPAYSSKVEEPARATADFLIDFRHRVAVERLLAGARFVAGIGVLIAIASNEGLLHSPTAKVLAGAYVIYATGVAWGVWVRPEVPLRLSNTLHLLDLAWATAITASSGNTSSHAFVLFAFVLVAAAYRWGLRRTLVDGVLVVAIVTVQSVRGLAGRTPWPFELDWFVLWLIYVVLLAVLVGALSERQHALSFQAIALGQVMARVGQATGLSSAVSCALVEASRVFAARRAVLLVRESDRDQVILWRVEPDATGTMVTSRTELEPDARAPWLVRVPPEVATYEARRAGGGDRTAVWRALDAGGQTVAAPFSLPPALASPRTWDSLVAVILRTKNIEGTFYLLDPAGRPAGTLRLGFLGALARQVSPILLDLYLVQGLRSRAEAQERARVSRELHDGVIQALTGLEMRIDVLRRSAETIAPAIGLDLAAVQGLLHDEVLNVRDVMERLRPVDVDARRLPVELGDLVDRFMRSTGVDARLEWDVKTLDLTPPQCREVLRIVQEALVNVRRHSAASRVDVRVEANARQWSLVVEDNGKGLGFAGRMTHGELEAQGRGPRVIRERVVALRGELRVNSSAGTRLEMVFPVPTAT